MGSSEVYLTLRKTGLRMTPLKRRVIDVFLSGGCGLSAGEVREKVSGSWDQSSVYRCLRSLTEAGFLRYGMGSRGVVLYRCERGFYPDHGHFHCELCGDTIPVENGLAGELLARIENTYGVKADTVEFTVEGRCGKCSEDY